MVTVKDDREDKAGAFLKRRINRRQAIKVGGLATAGLILSKPLLSTIRPTPAFAGYVLGANKRVDTFPESRAEVTLHHVPHIGVAVVTAIGPTVVEVTPDPISNGVAGTAGGRDFVETEIVSMELTGGTPVGPVIVRAGSAFGLPTSTGMIIEQGNSIPEKLEFPADSFFDVFFEIELPDGKKLHTETPYRVETVILSVPPGLLAEYCGSVIELELVDENGDPFPPGAHPITLVHACHIPGRDP